MGAGASELERKGAEEAISRITGKCLNTSDKSFRKNTLDTDNSPYTLMSEGSETTAFWLVEQCALQQDSKLSNSTCRNAIGGEKEYAKIVDTDAMENAKLFVCSNATGATNPPIPLFRS